VSPGTKTIRTVLRPREKEKRRRRCSANGPVTFRPLYPMTIRKELKAPEGSSLERR